jgi:predicted GIY-YIG superfamily endonuclease
MKYVYLLQSIDFPDQTYVGVTDDLKARLAKHNGGYSPHTRKYKP